MTQEQFGLTGMLFFFLSIVLWMIQDGARSYEMKDIASFLGFVSLAASVICCLLAIWGPGWLYG